MNSHVPSPLPENAAAEYSASSSPSASRSFRYVLAALVLLQLVTTWRHAWAYLELVRAGANHPLALILGVLGSLCLYVGAIRMLLPIPGGRRFMLVAGVCLGFSAPMWTFPFSGSLVAAFGSVLAFVSWWLLRPSTVGKGA